MLSTKQQSVYKYMQNSNVRSGEFRTPLFILYYNYRKYCTTRGHLKIVSPIEFGRRVSVYFQKGKSGRFAYYLTNVKPPEARERRRIRNWYVKHWTRMKDGKKKKG